MHSDFSRHIFMVLMCTLTVSMSTRKNFFVKYLLNDVLLKNRTNLK